MAHESTAVSVTQLEVSDSGTRLFDDRQHPWFGVIVSVGPNSQVDFLREGIGFIRSSELKYAVRGCERDLSPDFWMRALRRRPDATAIIDLKTDSHRRTYLQRWRGLCDLPLAGLWTWQTFGGGLKGGNLGFDRVFVNSQLDAERGGRKEGGGWKMAHWPL